MVHGPPGTGKTTTLAAGVREFVRAHTGARVLIAAPSNVAVDNLLEKLAGDGCLRLGAPSRTAAALQAYTVDARTSGSDEIQRELQ